MNARADTRTHKPLQILGLLVDDASAWTTYEILRSQHEKKYGYKPDLHTITGAVRKLAELGLARLDEDCHPHRVSWIRSDAQLVAAVAAQAFFRGNAPATADEIAQTARTDLTKAVKAAELLADEGLLRRAATGVYELND